MTDIYQEELGVQKSTPGPPLVPAGGCCNGGLQKAFATVTLNFSMLPYLWGIPEWLYESDYSDKLSGSYVTECNYPVSNYYYLHLGPMTFKSRDYTEQYDEGGEFIGMGWNDWQYDVFEDIVVRFYIRNTAVWSDELKCCTAAVNLWGVRDISYPGDTVMFLSTSVLPTSGQGDCSIWPSFEGPIDCVVYNLQGTTYDMEVDYLRSFIDPESYLVTVS